MKKLIAAIFVALLTTAGLVATTTTTANAVCPYTQCIATDAKVAVPATVKKGAKATIKVRVVPKSGNAQPVGRVTVTVKKVGGGFSQKITKSVFGGKSFSFVTKRLTKTGKYKVTAVYAPKSGSVFKGDTTTKSFRVVRRSA